MPVVVTKTKFFSEFSLPSSFTDAGVDNLDKCVGDKVKAQIDFYVKWSSEKLLLKFDSATKTISRINNLENGSFIEDGFNIGDTFIPTGATGNVSSLTIADITDRKITTIQSLVTETVEEGNLFGTKAITSIDFFYNLIRNTDQDNYLSLVDRYTQQKYYADNISANTTGSSSSLHIGTNSYGWVTELSADATGDVSSNTIIGMGITTDYKQQFRITQYFFVTPAFLVGQEQNLTEDPQFLPDYYEDTNCLRYVCKIDAKFDPDIAVVPHRIKEGFIDPKREATGLTSWFNESANGRAPEYSFKEIVYRDNATSEIMSSLDINKKVDVGIIIYSKSGLFLNYDTTGAVAGTYIVLNYARCPQSETEYVNTKTTFRQNFHYDRKYLYIGIGANGENFGTDYQVLTNIQLAFIDANNIKALFTVDYATYLKTFLKTRNNEDRNYMFWITTEKRTIILT